MNSILTVLIVYLVGLFISIIYCTVHYRTNTSIYNESVIGFFYVFGSVFWPVVVFCQLLFLIHKITILPLSNLIIKKFNLKVIDHKES
jgi:hypothetical protein